MHALSPAAFASFGEEVKEAALPSGLAQVASAYPGGPVGMAADAALLTTWGASGVESLRGRGHKKHLAAADAIMKGEKGHKIVNIASYMRKRDPKVVVIDSKPKIKLLLPQILPEYREKMNKGLSAYFASGQPNAFAFRGKTSDFIIGRGRLPVSVVEHEYGHIVDFREKGIRMDGSPRFEQYTRTLDRILQAMWKPSFKKKGKYRDEVAAWDKARVVGDPQKHEEVRRHALGTYEKAFHIRRGRHLRNLATAGTLYRGLSL